MKIIFLDRDGVINTYPGDGRYVTSWGEFHFLPGVKPALKRLFVSGYKIFIISNQAGVAKGIYSRESLGEITNNMLDELKEAGIEISGVYYCLHREEDNCSCRKPKSGLIERVLREHSIHKDLLSRTFFVGDSMRDIQTGRNAGCRTILVFSGKEKPDNQLNWNVQPDFATADLPAAVEIVLQV